MFIKNFPYREFRGFWMRYSAEDFAPNNTKYLAW